MMALIFQTRSLINSLPKDRGGKNNFYLLVILDKGKQSRVRKYPCKEGWWEFGNCTCKWNLMLSQLLLTFEIDRFVLEKALKGVERDRPIVRSPHL